MEIITQQARVRAFIDTALRRWSSSGFDAKTGLFEEGLDFDGSPKEGLARRGRTEARQVYVYALAHTYGFDPTGEYLDLAETVSRNAEAVYRHANGGWIFSADAGGKAVDDCCFAYEQAFRIMSLAALSHATGNREYAEHAEKCWEWLESIRHPSHGGFQLSVPAKAGACREQNPHMHLFEASLEAASIDSARWMARADALYALASSRFITPDGALIEFFEDDWTPDPSTGADVQPGHHFEWVWLLTQYAKRTSKQIAAIPKLYENALSWGLDTSGMGFDEVRLGGGVLRATKRLWVQCETLKGHLARYETNREAATLARAQTVLDRMFEHYLIEKNGAWYDQIDERGANISKFAPATSFYHVIIALHEFLRVTAAAHTT